MTAELDSNVCINSVSLQVTSSWELQRLPNWTVMCASTVCHHKWHQAESYNDCRIGQWCVHQQCVTTSDIKLRVTTTAELDSDVCINSVSPQVTSSGELQRLPNWTVMCASTVCHHKWHQAESYNDCRIGQWCVHQQCVTTSDIKLRVTTTAELDSDVCINSVSPQVTSSWELQRLPNWTVMCASTVCHHKWHQAESYNDCRIGQWCVHQQCVTTSDIKLRVTTTAELDSNVCINSVSPQVT